MKKLEIELSPQAMDLLEQLKRTGLFGLTKAEIATRFVDKALIELLQKPFPQVELKLKRRVSK